MKMRVFLQEIPDMESLLILLGELIENEGFS